jgi:sugar (pentulose or hexulose) kinase
MAAAGAGGLGDDVVSVVAGTTTPVQVSTATMPHDPKQHPWVSAHLVAHRWAVETNAGYPGMNFDWLARFAGRSVTELADDAAGSVPGANGLTAVIAARIWSEETWSQRPPAALIGFEPRHDRTDVARAFVEAHAYAIRANLEDLERAMGTSARQVCLLGGASRSTFFSQLVADVIGRPVSRVAGDYPAGRAFAWLAARATGMADSPPAFSGETIEPTERGAYHEGYLRFNAAADAVGQGLAGWAA